MKRKKRAYSRSVQNDIERLADTNCNDFWKKIGNIGLGTERRKNVPFEVVVDGMVSKDPEIVLEEWKSNFCTLLNPAYIVNEDNVAGKPVSTCLELGDVSEEVFDCIITHEEVLYVLRKAKYGKAPGFDDIPVDLLKNETALVMLIDLYNHCFTNGMVLSDWSKGVITPVPKNSTADPRDPLSYRGITLAPVMYKLYASVLNERIYKWCEENNIINDEHNGFVKGRSTKDHVSSITDIIETRKLKKQCTFAAFIDFRKAYDFINRSKLWDKLQKSGLKGRLL
ncbi:uncharacterized protein LOC123560975 [Mercenaria mercenaria]|uniref:uncharacterized protein LOC123560975 n=1 Tax=Mercenaria mercenaria TaxID=6596 RepID=UPI00234F0B95|nr:uncharacterized protein LOC123560975 [Mercenaria mercenaria]